MLPTLHTTTDRRKIAFSPESGILPDILSSQTRFSGPMSRQRKEIDTSTYTGRFAVRLRMLREKAGLTVDELAVKSGIPRRTLYNWEAAIRSATVEQFPELAQSLGVKVQKLLPDP